MRVFLLCNLGGWHVSVEVLSYDRTTNVMRVRCGKQYGSIEYDRVFLPDSKYNRQDFKIVSVENMEELNAKLTELRAGHRTGEAHSEAAWRHRTRQPAEEGAQADGEEGVGQAE